MNTAEKLLEYNATVMHVVNEVVCQCGHRICDGVGVIRSRCVKIVEGVALCRCKEWVRCQLETKEYNLVSKFF